MQTDLPPAPLLTETEQAWLDACPVGESRSLTSGGRTATVDRRIHWGAPVHVPTFTIEPRWEIGLHGSPTWDSTGHPPLHAVTVTSTGNVGPDIALQAPVGSFVQTTFRLSSETITAIA